MHRATPKTSGIRPKLPRGGVPIFLSSPIEVDSFAEGILGERDLVLRGVVGRQRHVVGVASVGQFPTG